MSWGEEWSGNGKGKMVRIVRMVVGWLEMVRWIIYFSCRRLEENSRGGSMRNKG